MNRRKPPTVLILQWPDRVRTTHTTVLRASGLDVLEVDSSTAAMDAARTIKPDVIVAMIGSRFTHMCADLCQAMKADRHLAGIPILLVSDADVSEDDMRLATDAGVLAVDCERRGLSQAPRGHQWRPRGSPCVQHTADMASSPAGYQAVGVGQDPPHSSL